MKKEKSSARTILLWFVLPWVIMATAGGFIYNSFKVPPMDAINRFVDLSGTDIEELVTLDGKRAESEGVKNPIHYPAFLKNGNDIGVLLIHGFTATPFEMRQLGEFLNKNGITVYIARLPGHGSLPENINKLTFVDMYESLKYGYFVLKNSCKKVFVVGQSMGGLLAGEIAAFNKVDGLVMLSPAFKIISGKAVFTPFLKYFISTVKKENLKPQFKEHYYQERPVRGVDELMKLSRHVQSVLDRIIIKTLIIQSKYDDIIDYKSTLAVYNKIKSNDKSFEIIDDNNVKHVLTTDENYMSQKVFDKILFFIKGGLDVQK